MHLRRWRSTKGRHGFLFLRGLKAARHPLAMRASTSACLNWYMIHLHLQRILLVTAADPPWDDRAKLAGNPSHHFGQDVISGLGDQNQS